MLAMATTTQIPRRALVVVPTPSGPPPGPVLRRFRLTRVAPSAPTEPRPELLAHLRRSLE